MFRLPLSWLRLAAIALALACQVSAGAAVPMRDAAEAQGRLVASIAVFCQSGALPVRHDRTPVHRQVPDHALCSALSAHGHAMAVLDGGTFLLLPSLARIGVGALPGARAPPARHVAAAFPRGPPAFV